MGFTDLQLSNHEQSPEKWPLTEQNICANIWHTRANHPIGTLRTL